MVDNNTKSKKERLSYDEDGGFIFMKSWSPALRWVCILPAVVVTFVVVKFLFLGIFLNMLEKNSELLSFYIGAITSGLVYFLMVDVAASVAPKNRVLTSIVISIFFGVLLICITLFAFYGILNADYKLSKTHMMIGLAIGVVSSFLGLYLGIITTKDRQKKTPKTLNDNIVK